MPGFDGTGPAGMGPMTGGGRGWCHPSGVSYARYRRYAPPYAVPPRATFAYGLRRPHMGLGSKVWGRGLGLGRGRGWGLGRGRGRW